MATTVTWGVTTSGDWSVGLNWSGFQPPVAGQDVQIRGTLVVTVDAAAAAADITLLNGATLDIDAALALSGTLSGPVILAPAGTLAGGTLEGQLIGTGGTLHDVTIGGSMTSLAFGYVVIDPATAASFGQSIAVSGTLTLEAGLYDGLAFAPIAGFSYQYGLVGTGGTVTLGSQAVVTDLGVWGGDLVNLGTIGNGPATTLSIGGGSFTNDGTLSLTPVTSSASAVVAGKAYHWTIATPPMVAIGAASVDNAGLIALVGGTLALSGASLTNTGTIALSDGTTQVFVNAGTNSAIENVTLATAVTLGAPYSYIDNSNGTISADLIDFAGPVAFASLGTLKGALQFDNVLDLGGHTLDASAYGTVRIDGEVTNGTLIAGTGTLVLAGATLDGVNIAPGGSVVIAAPLALVGVPAGATQVVLGATTSEMILPAGSMLSGVAITAGGSGATDTLSLPGGMVTLAPSGSVALTGGTLQVLGPGALEDDGTITVAAGTLRVTAPLDGTGTLALASGTTLDDTSLLGGALVVSAGSNAVLSLATLGENASVTVGAGASVTVGTLDGNAAITVDALARVTVDALAGAPTIAFAGGPALVVLPGTGALPVTLENLGAGDLVDFAAVSGVPSGAFGEGGATASGGTLDVTGASGETASVPLSAPASGLGFSVTLDPGGGTLVTAVACFRAGTRIATARGEVKVERLRQGDLIRTAKGRLVPVTWLGHRCIDCQSQVRPEDVWPVRVAAHAFAPGRPARDLYLSPDHAVWLDGALVPVRYLLNGATIAQHPVARVEYWHVELPAHDILLAENLPAESYLDTGNRAAFAGAPARRVLSPAAALRIWRRRACAPLLTSGPRLAAVHARLVARAHALGHRLTGAPSLRVLAGQTAAIPLGDMRFRLPAGTSTIRLRSRSFVPAHLAGHGHDPRRLGIAVSRLRLDGETLPLDDPRFGTGWYAPEPGWRWTSGDAVIAAAGARQLAIEVAITGRYWMAT